MSDRPVATDELAMASGLLVFLRNVAAAGALQVAYNLGGWDQEEFAYHWRPEFKEQLT